MFSQDMAQKIKNINAESNNKSSELAPLDDIDLDQQYRKNIENYDLEWLARNIFELSSGDENYPVGLNNRVVLSRQESGRWLMDEGEMRFRAFLLLRERHPDDVRWKSIPFNESSITVTERSERDFRQLSANLNRDEGSLFDIAIAISSLIESEGTDIVLKILANTGQKAHSKTALSRWKKIALAPENVVTDVTDLKIKDKTLIALLVDICNKNNILYIKLMADYRNDLLTIPLYRSAQQLWKSLSKSNAKKTKEIPQSDLSSIAEAPQSDLSSIAEAPLENSLIDHSDQGTCEMFIANDISILENGTVSFKGESGLINITLPQNISLKIMDSYKNE